MTQRSSKWSISPDAHGNTRIFFYNPDGITPVATVSFDQPAVCEFHQALTETLPSQPPGAGRGAWVAYYPDYSGLVLFGSEIEALRHAVENSMSVKFVRDGEEIR